MLVPQLCLPHCEPMDYSTPGSFVHEILQARILEWVATPFSGDLPDPGIEPRFPALQTDALPSKPPGNKGLRRASRLWTGPSPARDRQAGQPEPEGDNRSPREASSTKLQTGFFANQDSLGFWTVNIRREGLSQRSAPQRRHTAHLRGGACCTPRKPSGWDRGGDKSQLAKHLVT